MKENKIPEFKDIKEIIYNSAKEYANNIAFVIKHKEKDEVKYENITYTRLLEDINKLGTAIYKKGFENKRVIVIGRNSYGWALAHLTNLLGGMVSVPLDKDLQYEELENSIIRSEAECIVFDSKLKDKIQMIKENKKTQLKSYICMSEEEGFEDIYQLMDIGEKDLKNGNNSYVNKKIKENEMNILLFTSGTTSKSKAVMLSQKNVASNIDALKAVVDIKSTDTNIAFLPFHHIFGSTGMIMMLACGVKNVFPDGLRYIKQNLVEYKVTLFIGVPILVDAIYKAIQKEIEKQGKTKLINMALHLSKFLLKIGIDIRRKIFQPVLKALGGELRLVVVGGAPADPEVLKGFNDMGLLTIQGYGLTETSPVIALEDNNHKRKGSVGLPAITDNIKIVDKDENGIGEICVKGPNVMLGYYKMEKETADVLVSGWFHTGDLGYIDEDGYIFITGRKKSMIVLKNGKKVFPEELETLINRLDIVNECMVFGLPDKNDTNDLKLSVKVVYDTEVKKEKYPEKSEDELFKIIWEEIKKINTTFPRYKHIQNMILTKEELIKTTTKKVKRQEEMKLILKDE